jgi:hypothetical protein
VGGGVSTMILPLNITGGFVGACIGYNFPATIYPHPQTCPAITDNNSGSWTCTYFPQSVAGPIYDVGGCLCYSIDHPLGNTNISLAFTNVAGTDQPSCSITEVVTLQDFLGMGTGATFDIGDTALANQGGVNVITGSGTGPTNHQPNMGFGCAAYSESTPNALAAGPANGFTELTDNMTGPTLYLAYKNTTSTASQSTGWTGTLSQGWSAGMDVFDVGTIPTASATPTLTSTPTPTISATPTTTITATPPTPTVTPTPATPTVTATATSTATATATATNTPTPSATPTSTARRVTVRIL